MICQYIRSTRFLTMVEGCFPLVFGIPGIIRVIILIYVNLGSISPRGLHFIYTPLSQSRQSAIGFFSSRPNWDPSPTPSPPQASVFPPLVWGGGNTLAFGRSGGGSHFGRGDGHCGTLGSSYIQNIQKFPYKFATVAIASTRAHREKKDYERGKRGSHYNSLG